MRGHPRRGRRHCRLAAGGGWTKTLDRQAVRAVLPEGVDAASISGSPPALQQEDATATDPLGATVAAWPHVTAAGGNGAAVRYSQYPLMYGASHKNWIRFIRFIGMHRPLSQ